MHIRNITLALAAIVLVAGCSRDGNRRQVLENKGSDTLVNVAQAWAEAYRDINPDLAIAVTGGGSGTGIAALINGTVDLANSSRAMSDSERELARANGQEPVQHIVGYDALAIFLHRDNPLDSISVEQLAGIYGENGTIESWTQLGVEVPGCREQEIIRVSRQNNSGTYAYFREAILGEQGDFKLGSRDLHGSKDVVDLVHDTACAIGYSGLAYASPEIKMPCVSDGTGQCVTPSVDTAVDRSYAIARPLFMYTNGQPTGAVEQNLNFIMSDEGQCIIQEMGYAPAREVTCQAPAA